MQRRGRLGRKLQRGPLATRRLPQHRRDYPLVLVHHKLRAANVHFRKKVQQREKGRLVHLEVRVAHCGRRGGEEGIKGEERV